MVSNVLDAPTDTGVTMAAFTLSEFMRLEPSGLPAPAAIYLLGTALPDLIGLQRSAAVTAA
jgi:hypothetical protein